jgi:amino acid adenylation domain-containing protein
MNMSADSLQRIRVLNEAPGFAPLLASFTESTIDQQFNSIATRYPGRMAVIDRGSRLTYAELDQQSNRLADVINEHCGLIPRPVSLLMPQGARAVVAILGILKARKFYVPITCAAQDDWIRGVLGAIEPAMVLTDEDNLELARSVSPTGVICLDLSTVDLSASNGATAMRTGVSEDVAYVFFTSGTTGEPKGVIDTHRNVLHNILRYTNALAIRPDDRMSLIQSPAFSGTVSTLFSALLNGACVFPVDLGRESMGTLAAWLQEQAVTIYHSVPSIFRSLAVGTQEYPSIRVVRLEGDRGSRRDLERFQRHFPEGSVLVNGFGTTETGLVCQFFMDRQTGLENEVLPVGYPSTDMRVQIVDKSGNELPPGEVGEISVSSRYLATGYWRRSDLTDIAFQTVSLDGGFRRYLTGDLGRVAEDGALEHLGREDSNIRFRGHWIVPAVIEEVLVSCPGVDEAAVTVAGNIGNERLIAYVKYKETEAPDVGDLRKRLVARLPRHSVPSRFVGIRELPVTANGKIDRSALPGLDRRRPNLSTRRVSAQSILHMRMIELWRDVLELDEVGILDDFFELGGDSLRAIQMLTGLEILTDRHIPPDILLGNATIEQLADALLRHDDYGSAPDILNAGGDQRPLFFLHGDYLSGGYYVRELARYLGADQPVVSIRPCGLAGDPVPSTYKEMAELHLNQIQAIQPAGPYLLGGTCNGGLVAFEISRLLTQQGETVAQLVMIDASASNLGYRRLWESRALKAVTRFDAKLGERAFLYIRKRLEWWRRHQGQGRLSLGLGLLSRKIGSLFREPALHRGDDSTVPQQRSVGDYWATLRETYQRIDQLYFAMPYEGSVALLWPDESLMERLSEARVWWERICPQIEFHEIQGTNVTCLTRHVQNLAQAIEKVIDRERA